MTIPINFKLPELDKASTPEQMSSYIQDLTYELQNMYEKTAQNVNGVFRNSADLDGSEWIPTVFGGTVEGSPQYTFQQAYVLRAGLMVDYWFAVSWIEVGGASGNLRIKLPYKVSPPFAGSSGAPGDFFGWGGSLESGSANAPGASGLNFAGGTSINCKAAMGLTFASVISSGSLLASTALNISRNVYINGHIRYIGLEDE